MRRAVIALLLLTALPLPAAAQKPEGVVDGVAMLDFKSGHRFKVGDWVKYRTRGESYQGFRTDYVVTVLIAGEERWWGEDCFWVETHSSYAGHDPEITASLISFAVFRDSLPNRRFARYLRKYFDGWDSDGNPIQQFFLRAPAELTRRGYEEPHPPRTTDTLGVAPVETPAGTFDALRVKTVVHSFTTQQDGDSTVYFEVIEDRTTSWSDRVPLTRLVREEMVTTQRRRAWLVGESENAPLRIAEEASGSTELLEFGSGMKSPILAERFQRSLAEQYPGSPDPMPVRRRPGRQG